MAMDLLQHLAEVELAAQLTDPEQIYKLRVLVAAGHVYASIPLPYYGLGGRWGQDAATVHCITPLGYKVLRYFGTAHAALPIGKDRFS